MTYHETDKNNLTPKNVCEIPPPSNRCRNWHLNRKDSSSCQSHAYPNICRLRVSEKKRETANRITLK